MPEKVLRVYENRSEYVNEEGIIQNFEEGAMTKSSAENYQKITKALGEERYFENLILELKSKPYIPDENDIDESLIKALDLIKSIINSITSEVGRAIGGLLVLQLVIKSVCPNQSIRLHKGNTSGSSYFFSWKDGLPMRVIDKKFNTPILRKYKLIRLNADGVMMTRSLAENYPYTLLYKAQLRGAKEEWLKILDMVEDDLVDSEKVLKVLISGLIQKNIEFVKLGEKVLNKVNQLLAKEILNVSEIQQIFNTHLNESDYHARIFEIIMHTFYQTIEEYLGDDSDFCQNFKLYALQQMRSANLKHGNVGDVELVNPNDEDSIIEAWDMKYGKDYLYDELCELRSKLNIHKELDTVGFITSQNPVFSKEINEKIEEIETLGFNVKIIDYQSFISTKLEEFDINLEEFYPLWLKIYTETLCLKRYDKAPIDEPTYGFLTELNKILKQFQQTKLNP